MTKSKTNALEALRALISERQQYDQWILTLESKREGTPEHVFNRVYSDYRSRRDRVVEEIKGHSEELQLSINALSSRLGEVAKEEEARRDTLQEAELRAAVGEYDEGQWESLRAEANRELDKIAADRGSLENQLAELDSIRKLSEVTATGAEAPTPAVVAAQPEPPKAPAPQKPEFATLAPAVRPIPPQPVHSNVEPPPAVGWPARDIVESPLAAAVPAPVSAPASALASAPVAAPAPRPFSAPEPLRASTDPAAAAPRPSAFPPAAPPAPAPPARKKRDTPSGKDAQISTGFSKPIPTPGEARPEVNKTLKCPECGTANYPTEWYCERCGGELATM
jgi:hypothetical protein